MASTNTSSSSNDDDVSLVKILWRVHSRPFVDVILTKEEKMEPSTNAILFSKRIQRFAGAVWKDHCNKTEDSSPHSSLDPFFDFVNSNNNNNIPPGRHLIHLDHSEFLAELNRFECHGKDPSPQFITKDSFGAFLYHVPQEALLAVACGLVMSLSSSSSSSPSTTSSTSNSNESSPVWNYRKTQLVVQFVHVEPVVPMKHIRTGLVGKFLTLRGHVVRARPRRLRIATADFACPACGQMVTHAFVDGRYTTPTGACPSCKSSKTLILHRPSTRYQNLQELRLQEVMSEENGQAGRTPRQLVVEMSDLHQCRPGDLVQITCIVRAINTAVQQGWRGKRAQESSTYQLYLQGHSVHTLSDTNSQSRRRSQQQRSQDSSSNKNSSSSNNNQVTYTAQQLEAITKLCHADHRIFGLPERRAFPFDLLVRSLCPSIIGHDKVKAGLLLCLLGGTSDTTATGNNKKSVSIRSNSHMLIVGDPGMGKSQMLLAASQLAARSVYVGGNTSSTTGLTVTLTKEEGTGEAGIEAGALVLADQGVCCIDEFDKMAASHQDGLLEAMEQQQVSIAKAGVVASLPARCALVAAANPRHGSYSCDKTVAENLNMAKPILSRFDLVFILRDRADKQLDRLVSSNIMNLYRKTSTAGDGKGGKEEESSSTWHPQPHHHHYSADNNNSDRVPLGERLAWVNSFQKTPLPADLVRDYIAYAREYCRPKMTPQAAAILQHYYMSLRYPENNHPRSQDTVPITTRQLEALIRLCQARAKACLRDFCLEEDALDVVELMQASVEQVHRDEAGVCDPIRGGPGGQSNRKRKRQFVNQVQTMVGLGGECTMDDLRRIADQTKVGLSEFQPLVEDLRHSGVLLKKSNGNYQVL